MSFQKATLIMHFQLLCLVAVKEEEEKRSPRRELDGCWLFPVNLSGSPAVWAVGGTWMLSWGSDPGRRSRGAPGPAHSVSLSLCHCV